MDRLDMSTVAGMDWVQDMTARWVRVMSASGDGRTPLDEAAQQINAISETPARKSGFGWLKRSEPAPVETPLVTVLCRQLIAAVVVSDLMIDRLCALEGRTREQVLDRLTGDFPEQLRDQQWRALQVELSGSCELLKDPERAMYSGLGRRIERLLGLAEEQASELVDAARAEAAKITAAARAEAAETSAPAGTREPSPD
jgi:hypothetical protein